MSNKAPKYKVGDVFIMKHETCKSNHEWRQSHGGRWWPFVYDPDHLLKVTRIISSFRELGIGYRLARWSAHGWVDHSGISEIHLERTHIYLGDE